MWPEIMSAVIGREISGSSARLDGVRRLCVKDEVYPALVPADASFSDGVLYENLAAEEMAALNRFEGGEYDRRAMTVLSNGVVVEAEVYFASERALLTNDEWHPEQVADADLDLFRREYKGWE